MWYGEQIGKTSDSDKPTYVYPQDLREEVRSRFSEEVGAGRDADYEQKPGVYHVTWQDIERTTWPKPPKSCKLCSASNRFTPYWKTFTNVTDSFIET